MISNGKKIYPVAVSGKTNIIFYKTSPSALAGLFCQNRQFCVKRYENVHVHVHEAQTGRQVILDG